MATCSLCGGYDFHYAHCDHFPKTVTPAGEIGRPSITPNPLIVRDDNEMVVSFRVPIDAFFEWAASYLTEPN